jgi:hypothetical protein
MTEEINSTNSNVTIITKFDDYIRKRHIRKWRIEDQILAFIGSLKKKKPTTMSTTLGRLIGGLSTRTDRPLPPSTRVRKLSRLLARNARVAKKNKAKPVAFKDIDVSDLEVLKCHMLETASVTLQRIKNT